MGRFIKLADKEDLEFDIVRTESKDGDLINLIHKHNESLRKALGLEQAVFLFDSDRDDKDYISITTYIVKPEEMMERLWRRRSGRTTRIVDSAIQNLFNKGFCILSDHHKGTNQSTIDILDRFIKRFELEHGDSSKLLKVSKIRDEEVIIEFYGMESNLM